MTYFITFPCNIDYLIPGVRLHIGDTSETQYSDSLIRSALVYGIKQLQRRWGNRYLIYASGIESNPQPSDVPAGYVAANLPDGQGLIPLGLSVNDVFRNPFQTFTDPGTQISQEDEYPIVLVASMLLMKSVYTSSIQSFQNWSDGEFSFSNVASARAYQSTLSSLQLELDSYFKKRLASPARDSFAVWDF